MKRRILICLVCLLFCLGGCKTEEPLGGSAAEETSSIAQSGMEEVSPASSETAESSFEEVSSEEVSPEEESRAEESSEEEVKREPFPADAPRKIVVEIYSFDSYEMVASFEITEREFCNKAFLTFEKCFDEVCEKYPTEAAPDRFTVTDYCVAVYLYAYEDEEMTTEEYCVDLSYPYGHTNDIYKLIHSDGDVFHDYVIRCGKEFIDMIDGRAKEYIPKD